MALIMGLYGSNVKHYGFILLAAQLINKPSEARDVLQTALLLIK